MSGLAKAMWRQAQRDFEAAGAALGNGFFEWTVFTAQQAAEKSLKAVLLAAGDPAPPLHNLDRLFDALVAAGAATPAEQAGLKQPLLALTQGWPRGGCCRATPCPGSRWRRPTC